MCGNKCQASSSSSDKEINEKDRSVEAKARMTAGEVDYEIV